MTLTLMSWNLWDYDRPPIERDRQAGELSYIKKLKPDILCLQEFCDDGDDDHRAAGFGEFCRAVEMTGRLAPSSNSRFNTAVLWREGIHEGIREGIREVGPWQAVDEGFWHAVGATVLEIAPNIVLRVGSAHLSPHSPDSRVADVKRLDWLTEAGIPTIVAGDWNNLGEDDSYDADLPPDSDNIGLQDRRTPRALTDMGLTDVAPHLGAPWQQTYGHLGTDLVRIDAFRASATALPLIESYEVDQGAGALSDHRPILIRVAV